MGLAPTSTTSTCGARPSRPANAGCSRAQTRAAIARPSGWSAVGLAAWVTARSTGRPAVRFDGGFTRCKYPRAHGSTGGIRYGKGGTEAVEGGQGIAGGEGFEADDPVVSQAIEGGGNGRIIDLAGAGFTAAGDVGHLD